MIVPMIDQALAQARLLIGADPKQGGVRPPERAKYEDRGRSFSRVPAREWRRLLNEALPRVGLVLVTESEALTGGDLTVTFSLTHVGCGDVRSLTRVEPLPPAKSRSMGKQWAHTRAVNAIARTLLWQWDDEDEAADGAEDDAEKVQREEREEHRAPDRPRSQRPTKALRATNTLAGVLVGAVGAPAIELGQAEQEQEEQRAEEAERQAEERMAEQSSAPVADPDWLDETIPDRATLEDRLRAERDQIQTRDEAQASAEAPAEGALPPAAHNEGSPTDAGAPPCAGGSTLTVEESSPAPEPDSPGQGASTLSMDEAERRHGFGSPEHRGLCVTTEGRCAECDLPLAADSDVCPDPDCTSHLPAVPLTEPTREEDRCSDCGKVVPDGLHCSCEPLTEPSTSQVNVVSNVATASAQRHQGHEGTTHYEGDDCPRVGASEDSGPAPDPLAEFFGRRAMTAKEDSKPVKCALCKSDVEPLSKYYAGSSRSRRAHVGCVKAAERGERPRKVGT